MSAPSVSGTMPASSAIARHPEAEMRAVADIHLDAVCDRFLRERVHLAVAVTKLPGWRENGMREDVAGLQEPRDLRKDRVRIDAVRRRSGSGHSCPKWM